MLFCIRVDGSEFVLISRSLEMYVIRWISNLVMCFSGNLLSDGRKMKEMLVNLFARMTALSSVSFFIGENDIRTHVTFMCTLLEKCFLDK